MKKEICKRCEGTGLYEDGTQCDYCLGSGVIED